MRKKIKGTFITAFSLLLLGGSLYCQTNSFSYGLNLGLNYPTIGAQYEQYAGEGNLSMGMFIQYKPYNGVSIGHPSKNKTYTLVDDEFARRLTYVLQPSFSITSFRQTNLDRRFTNNYLELSGLIFIQPFTYVDEFKIFTGLRPGYVVSYSSEIIKFGEYVMENNPDNKNRAGKIDVIVPVGLSLDLSPAVTIELIYNHSFTDRNSESVIKGRSSFVEISLRLNALGMMNQFSKKEDVIKDKINKLHKGSLLIMLPTPNPSEMNALKIQNQTEQVELVANELKLRNKKVMQEFKSYFDFSPVYYFMDTSAYKIVSKNFKNVFVNSNLEVDPMIKPDSSNFFVASFCEDISSYTTKHVYGLFVYDENIIQFPPPFNVPINLIGANLDGDPINFFRTKYYDYSKLSFERIITKFNKRMWRYVVSPN